MSNFQAAYWNLLYPLTSITEKHSPYLIFFAALYLPVEVLNHFDIENLLKQRQL